MSNTSSSGTYICKEGLKEIINDAYIDVSPDSVGVDGLREDEPKTLADYLQKHLKWRRFESYVYSGKGRLWSRKSGITIWKQNYKLKGITGC